MVSFLAKHASCYKVAIKSLLLSDGCELDGYSKSKAKRVRTTFTEDQLQILQANFQIDSNPDGQDLERIASLTGLSKRVTQVWFQNSRARQKKHVHGGRSKSMWRRRMRSCVSWRIIASLLLSDSSLDEMSDDSTMRCMKHEI